MKHIVRPTAGVRRHTTRALVMLILGMLIAPFVMALTPVVGEQPATELASSYDELLTLNTASAPDVQRTPAVASAPAPAVAPPMTRYTVRSGDTLSKIMFRQCGSGDWESLFDMNRTILSNPNIIQPDDVINLPCAPAPAPAPAAPAPVAEASEPTVNAEPAATVSAPAPTAWAHPFENSDCTSGWGERWGDLHSGVDLANGRTGSPILAVASGTVRHAGASRGYGYAVVIEHADGVFSEYGHMSLDSIEVNVGEVVRVGQQIAEVGNEGRSTGPHLHFAIGEGGYFNDDDRTDPVPFMAERGVVLC